MEIDLDRSTRKQTGDSDPQSRLGDSHRSTKENKKEEKGIVLELVALNNFSTDLLPRCN
jgi:hypothetical protein